MSRKLSTCLTLLGCAVALSVSQLIMRGESSGGGGAAPPAAGNASATMNTPAEPQQRPEDVSIVQLIAAPASFEGKYVRLVGFVKLQSEGTAVYLHEEDYKHHITKNALWLSIGREERQPYARLHQKYAIVEGIFDSKMKGHRGLYSGSLRDIKRLEAVHPEP